MTSRPLIRALVMAASLSACTRNPSGPGVLPPITDHADAEIYVDALLEIGDRSGGEINLRRPLVSGEVLRITQQLGTCRASQSYSVVVQ